MISQVLPQTQLQTFFIPIVLALKCQQFICFSSSHILKIAVGLEHSSSFYRQRENLCLGIVVEPKFSYQKRRVFSVYLLLLLPSQGGWHRSSDWQSADLGRTKKKKSQQCVCHQNTCDISTISKAEEIMGSFLYISQFHLQSGFFTSTYVNGLMLQNYTFD